MQFLSHGGLWDAPVEKDSRRALSRAFDRALGIATSVRDRDGALVIAPGPARGGEQALEDLLRRLGGRDLPLALGVRAAGLAPLVARALAAHRVRDPFVFDLAVPEARAYLDLGVPVFTRLSEEERWSAWAAEASGVWLDSFGPLWYDDFLVRGLLEDGRRVALVSPELRGRDAGELWSMVRRLTGSTDASNLLLCTARPLAAAAYFELALAA